MEASIFGTVLFVASFVLLFVSVFQFKKSNNILNGVSWLIISLISILCYGMMAAGIINIINIPINIISVGIVYLITGVFLQIIIRKQNEKQKYKWESYDFGYVVIFLVLIFIVAGSYFTSSLKLMYFNSDAAVHFKNAMYVLRNERLENMYFAPLLNALVMETFMPFVAEVNLYKIYILTDAALFLLESSFFMVLVRDFLITKAMKIIGIVISLIYVLGYPMNSYLYSFFYWAIGVMLIGYMLLMLRYYENKEIDRRVSIVGMMLCSAALPVTYMLFGPVIYIATFLVMLIFCKREGKLICKKNIFLAFKIFLIPTIIAIYYCYFDYLRNMDMSAVEILNVNGGVYRELFINFVWTLPFVIYMFIKAWKNKKFNETIVFTLFTGVFTLIMFVLVYKGKITSYYYYKFYFPIWLFFYVLTIQAIKELWQKSKEMIISFGIVFAFLAVVCFSGIEQKIINSQTGLTSAERTSGLFDIYKFNIGLFNMRGLKYPNQYFEICNYVIEELDNDEKEVPLLATIDNYSSCYWYEGITGQDCEEFYGWSYSFDEVQDKIEKQQIDYFVVYKDSPIYYEQLEYFSEFEYVFENDYGLIARVE